MNIVMEYFKQRDQMSRLLFNIWSFDNDNLLKSILNYPKQVQFFSK